MKSLAKISLIAIPACLYLNEKSYIACLGIKRSLVALAFEGVIYLNYRIVSLNYIIIINFY